MIELKTLKNKYPESDIYVLGSGASLSFVDGSFWNNKIVICVNSTIELNSIANVKDLYLVAKEPSKSAQDAAFAKKALIVMCEIHSGEKKGKKNVICHPDNTVLFVPTPGCISNKEQVTDLEKSTSTIISGIHLAVFMGCRNVMLAGHDCGYINGNVHVKGYNKASAVTSTGKYPAWMHNQHIEAKTLEFKAILKEKYGVNICSLNPFINFGMEGNKYKRF